MNEINIKRQIMIEKVTAYVMIALLVVALITGIVLIFQETVEPMLFARAAIIIPFAIWYIRRRFKKINELKNLENHKGINYTNKETLPF